MSIKSKIYRNDYSPSICVTHNCNLSCIYCYQHHDADNSMSLKTAKKCIDWILANVPENKEALTINLIGGEPLLEFQLIQKIYEYTMERQRDIPVRFFASTNGTLLTSEMKEWITERRHNFILGLSLDGNKETQDFNRSNSFDLIDFEFFLKNWSNQGIKMTLSEFSLNHLAENIKFVHNLGFKRIDGVNLFEGDFDWNQESIIIKLIPQLQKIVDFYLENPKLELNQMFNKKIELCSASREKKHKCCGIGTNVIFFDTDGKKYPCSFVTPMTFKTEELDEILKIDFNNDDLFVDEECYKECYIFPVCSVCAGGNYLKNKSFGIRNKDRCKINKLITLFIADLHSKRILRYPELYPDETRLYHLIEAIQNVRNLYLEEFSEYIGDRGMK